MQKQFLSAARRDRPARPTLEVLEDRLVPSGTTYTFQQGVNGYGGSVAADISDTGGGNGETFRDGAANWCVGVLPSEHYSISPLVRFENLGIPAGSTVTSASLTIHVVSWHDGQRIIGHYLNVPWDNNTSADPEAGNFDPNKLGWLVRAPNSPWGAPGATGEGSDVIAGKSFALPEQGVFSSSGDTVVTAALDPAVVQAWVNDPSKNNGVILTVDLPDHHMDFIQPQRTRPVRTPGRRRTTRSSPSPWTARAPRRGRAATRPRSRTPHRPRCSSPPPLPRRRAVARSASPSPAATTSPRRALSRSRRAWTAPRTRT